MENWRDDGKCGTDYPLRSGEPSECNPTGDKPCCNDRLNDCGNTEEYCICDECRDYRPINNRDCEISELEGFLKYRCYNQKLQDHFKCALSETRYKPRLETWVDSRGVFMVTTTSDVCENDPSAYQACGFNTLITAGASVGQLCGGNFSSEPGDGQYPFMEIDKPQQGSGVCDDVCNNDNTDKTSCQDESNCGGYLYGRECKRSGKVDYVPVHWICNGVEACDDNSDEESCDAPLAGENCTHYYAHEILGKENTVPIRNFTRCSIFDITTGVYPYCIDFSDQTDCNDTERIGGFCEVGGEIKSVSKYMVCYLYKAKNYERKFCDDGSESFCETFNSDSEECIVHRHKMCDGFSDCRDGSDELNDDCKLMTEDFRCQRKFGKYQQMHEIPVSWLLNGKEDCQNGEDEETSKWKECLSESDRTRYVIPRTEQNGCMDVFKCNVSSTLVSVRLDIMCDGVESCGQERQVENEVCRYSRDFPDVEKIAPRSNPNTGEITDLCTGIVDNRRDSCEQQDFPGKDRMKTLGVMKRLSIPNIKVSCQDKFGEFYVYLSCMDRCENATCPIADTPLEHDACPGQYPDRIYTLAGDKDLTFVTRSSVQGNYENDYFQCRNKRCVKYSQVCDLTNDCGDWSDEETCINSILCSNNQSRISLEQQCDGLIDCYDLSDECNENCGKQILGHLSLSVICWIMGILATILNIIFIFRTAYSVKMIKTGKMLETKLLIMTIALGDLLNGIYLIAIATYDTIIYGSGYCKHQAEWLSSRTCSALGVISTIASQTSLFAMTALAITRYIGLTRTSLKTPSPVSKRAIVKTSSKVAIILASSAIIALIPLAPQLEDNFVEGIYYESENNVFIGFPNKERHVNVLNAYFGDQSNASYDMSWEEIHKNVAEMFTNEHGTIRWRKVHYYANDGHCLFKYFVRNDDARRSRQSSQVKTEVVDIIDFEGNKLLWCVQAINFVCFLVMSISYVRITIQTWKSSSSSGQNSSLANVRQKEKIELKISLIIVTDFICWIPYITICALHNFQFIDATHWYVYFAMVLLPVNSVINPLLYDDALSGLLVSTTRSVITKMSSFASMIYSRSSKLFSRSQEREDISFEMLDGIDPQPGGSAHEHADKQESPEI